MNPVSDVAFVCLIVLNLVFADEVFVVLLLFRCVLKQSQDRPIRRTIRERLAITLPEVLWI
jgi:hypothetical protein